jgi:hypothetical protein
MKKSKPDDRFAYLPWGREFREGTMPNYLDSSLAVLPVITAFANGVTRKAFPGYETISILACVSKSAVKEAIDELVSFGFFSVTQEKTGRYARNVYCMKWPLCGEREGRDYIALHHDIIVNGLWGTMSPATRRVYLILRAHCVHSANACEDGYNKDGSINYEILDDYGLSDKEFLPTGYFDPVEFQELSGVNPRTWRHSVLWLREHRIILADCTEHGCDGILFPFKPGLYASGILKKLDKRKTEQRKPTAGALRSMAFAQHHRQSRVIKIPDGMTTEEYLKKTQRDLEKKRKLLHAVQDLPFTPEEGCETVNGKSCTG